MLSGVMGLLDTGEDAYPATDIALEDQAVPVMVFSSSLEFLGLIDDYAGLVWTRRWRQADSWEMQVNRYAVAADLLQENGYVMIRRGGVLRAGIIRRKSIALDDEGKLSENWTVGGPGAGGLLARRIALHLTAEGTGYDESTGPAETVMRHYVEANAVSPVDSDRAIAALALHHTDYGRGAEVEYRARFQPLPEILEEVSIASGLGWGCVPDLDLLKFVFTVFQGTDRSASVAFAPEFGNVRLLGYTWNAESAANVGYVAGQGEDAARTVVAVGTATGVARQEVLIDARDLATTDELTARGETRLAEYAEEVSLEMEYLQGGPFVYLDDWDLGDIVHVEYPGIASLDARVIEVEEEYAPDGFALSVVVGSEYPDLITQIKRQGRQTSAEVRR